MTTRELTIDEIADEFNRLSPSQVDESISGNGAQEAGHNAHDGDGEGWPAVGWYCAGGNTGNPVVRIHPDDIQAAHGLLVAMPDGAIDTGAIQDIEAAFSAAGIRCEWCY